MKNLVFSRTFTIFNYEGYIEYSVSDDGIGNFSDPSIVLNDHSGKRVISADNPKFIEDFERQLLNGWDGDDHKDFYKEFKKLGFKRKVLKKFFITLRSIGQLGY